MNKVCFLIMGTILLSRVFGQNFVNGYDSLPFYKPDAWLMYYLFPDPALTAITLRENYPDRRYLSHKQLITDVLFGTVTLFTNAGLTVTNDLDVIWELSAGLECNEDHLNWRVALFCTGYRENEREQVSNDDGSHWTEVTRTSHYEWENESVGIICEGNDTIGQFREEDFVLITHGGIRKSYFYIDNVLACIFSPDVDDYKVKIQDRIMPLMMLHRTIPVSERPDWYRLAIVTRFLNYQLGRKTSVQ